MILHKIWGKVELGSPPYAEEGHMGHPYRYRPSRPHLLQLLQLALSITPLQLQVGQLAPQSLQLFPQGAALPACFRQRLSGSIQPFLGDRG